MPIGVCYIKFHIPAAGSLKDKRRVVKSIRDRLKNRFNVSVAEMGDLDRWQSGLLGFSCISNDRAYLDGQMASLIAYVESESRILITDVSTEVF